MDTGRVGRLSDSILGKRPAAVLCGTDGGPSSSRKEEGDTTSGQPAAKLIIKVETWLHGARSPLNSTEFHSPLPARRQLH